MEHLSLYRCLSFSEPGIISFYGAGGKTALLRKLAEEMVAAGKKVLITTTTRIYSVPGVSLFCEPDPGRAVEGLIKHFRTDNLAVLGKSLLPDEKVEGIDPGQIGFLRDKLQVSVLVEADGARGRSLKGYAPYEPVLPPDSDYIIPILGGDALGNLLTSANTHRLEYFLKSAGAPGGVEVTEKTLSDAFCCMLEKGRAQAPRASTILVINKADRVSCPGPAALKTAALIGNTFVDCLPEKLLLTEAGGAHPVKISLNLLPQVSPVVVSCVILAAGKSSRMGVDKLFLQANGKTIFQHTLEKVISAGFKEIVVVTAPGKTDIIPSRGDKQNKGLSIKAVENRRHNEGMSTSMIAGLQALDYDVQGVLFALADQPQVPVSVYEALRERHLKKLPLVTCPVYRGSRGNPVLFDRRTWPDLIRQSGDRGGRAVLNCLEPGQVEYVRVETPAVLWDIDSPEDYFSYLDNIKGAT